MKKLLLGALAALMILVVGTTAIAETAKTPDATIKVSSTSIALGVGVTWGKGTVRYMGEDKEIKINGLSVVDLGISSLDAQGEVYNLNKIEDLEGTFTAMTGEITIGGGVGGTRMKNQNGVVIRMSSNSVGAKLALAAEGMKVELG